MARVIEKAAGGGAGEAAKPGGEQSLRRPAYDSLDGAEQAAERMRWEKRIERLRSELNIAAELEAAGCSWVCADEQGRVVHHGALRSSSAAKR